MNAQDKKGEAPYIIISSLAALYLPTDSYKTRYGKPLQFNQLASRVLEASICNLPVTKCI